MTFLTGNEAPALASAIGGRLRRGPTLDTGFNEKGQLVMPADTYAALTAPIEGEYYSAQPLSTEDVMREFEKLLDAPLEGALEVDTTPPDFSIDSTDYATPHPDYDWDGRMLREVGDILKENQVHITDDSVALLFNTLLSQGYTAPVLNGMSLHELSRTLTPYIKDLPRYD